ncbi:MAG TPA: hypothetical protein VGQ86_07510 [Candidatus Limnocylindria bacterium]|nr:hypothetical protein [Candidatus Limnocylindria bacterium]
MALAHSALLAGEAGVGARNAGADLGRERGEAPEEPQPLVERHGGWPGGRIDPDPVQELTRRVRSKRPSQGCADRRRPHREDAGDEIAILARVSRREERRPALAQTEHHDVDARRGTEVVAAQTADDRRLEERLQHESGERLARPPRVALGRLPLNDQEHVIGRDRCGSQLGDDSGRDVERRTGEHLVWRTRQRVLEEVGAAHVDIRAPGESP